MRRQAAVYQGRYQHRRTGMAPRRFAVILTVLSTFVLWSLLACQAAAQSPVLQGAVSRFTHNGVPFDVQLPLTGTSGIECRNTTNVLSLVFTFDKDVNAGTATVTGGASVSGSPTFSAHTMTVNLSGVANLKTYLLTVHNVAAADGTGTLASA